jgi:hypothetical protein
MDMDMDMDMNMNMDMDRNIDMDMDIGDNSVYIRAFWPREISEPTNLSTI